MQILELINPQMILAQIICFFLVLFLLRKFLWKPVFTVLEERKSRVAAELKAVDDARGEVAKIKADYQLALAKIDQTAQDRFREMERLADVKAQDVRAGAHRDAMRIIDEAKQEVRGEMLKAREALRSEMVDLVIGVTGKVIQEKLTFDEDRVIIEQMLREMDAADARENNR